MSPTLSAAREGLDLRLMREGSWAAVRDKLNAGLFDAAHMRAPVALMRDSGHIGSDASLTKELQAMTAWNRREAASATGQKKGIRASISTV